MQQSIAYDVPTLVEQTLAAYGSWDTVSFLLACNLLQQEGYEAWRVGEYACLEDALTGDRQYLLLMLNAALAHARNLGLDEVPVTWNGWGDMAGKTLRLFHDDACQQQFQMRLSPRHDRPQLDLFMDASRNVLLNQIRTALLERSADLNTLFDRAFDENPNDADLINLDVVRAAMQTQEVADPITWQTRLEKIIEPIVREAFPHRADDILVPLWRRMAEAVAHLPFEPRFAAFHASAAWLRARAWEQVVASIEASTDWMQQPILHQRKITALIAMHDESGTRGACFDACWHCPDAANDIFQRLDLHGCGLQRLWKRFAQLGNEPGAALFPAWVSLGHAGRSVAPMSDLSRQTEGGKLYAMASELIAHEAGQGESLELRHQLKNCNSWLLQVYLGSK